MDIQREESGSKGAFFVKEGERKLAFLSYTKAGPTRIIIDHTEVSEVLKGRNAGKQLVAAAVDYARKNKVKILPLCPFARSVFDRVSEYADVLD